MGVLQKILWEKSKKEAEKKFGDNSAYKYIHASKLYKKKIEENEKLKTDMGDGKTIKAIAKKYSLPLSTIFEKYIQGLKNELSSGNDVDEAKKTCKQHLVDNPDHYKHIIHRADIINKPLKEFEENGEFDPHHLDTLHSFRQRLEYCTQFLEKIGSGSSRIVFKIDDKKVLKLAKNQKGIEQNTFEFGGDSDIIAPVYDGDRMRTWLISAYAKKINKSRFKELSGFNIEEVYKYLMNRYNDNLGKRKPFEIDDLEKNMKNSEVIENLAVFALDYDLNINDLGRISSYGEINNKLVVTDYGGSNNIISSFYENIEKTIKTAKQLYAKDLLENKIDKKEGMGYWVKKNWQFINKT